MNFVTVTAAPTIRVVTTRFVEPETAKEEEEVSLEDSPTYKKVVKIKVDINIQSDGKIFEEEQTSLL